MQAARALFFCVLLLGAFASIEVEDAADASPLESSPQDGTGIIVHTRMADHRCADTDLLDCFCSASFQMQNNQCSPRNMVASLSEVRTNTLCPGSDAGSVATLIQATFLADVAGNWSFRYNVHFSAGSSFYFNGDQIYSTGVIHRVASWPLARSFVYWMPFNSWNTMTFVGVTGWEQHPITIQFKRPGSDNWETFSTSALKLSTPSAFSCDEPSGVAEPPIAKDIKVWISSKAFFSWELNAVIGTNNVAIRRGFNVFSVDKRDRITRFAFSDTHDHYNQAWYASSDEKVLNLLTWSKSPDAADNALVIIGHNDITRQLPQSIRDALTELGCFAMSRVVYHQPYFCIRGFSGQILYDQHGTADSDRPTEITMSLYSTPADQVDTTIVSRGGALTTVVAGGNPFSFTQGDYKNWADVTLPTSGFELIVEAKMPNDFYVGLHNVAVPTSPHGVQICAGCWGNSRNGVWQNHNFIADSYSRELDLNQFKTFWIRLKDGQLTVGRSSVVGQLQFLSAQLDMKIFPQKEIFIGFRTCCHDKVATARIISTSAPASKDAVPQPFIDTMGHRFNTVRGINVVTIDSQGRTYYAHSDTFDHSTDADQSVVDLLAASKGKAVIAMINDEASNQLPVSIMNQLEYVGSRAISNLGYRTAYIFVRSADGRVLYDSAPNSVRPDTREGFGYDLKFQTKLFPLAKPQKDNVFDTRSKCMSRFLAVRYDGAGSVYIGTADGDKNIVNGNNNCKFPVTESPWQFIGKVDPTGAESVRVYVAAAHPNQYLGRCMITATFRQISDKQDKVLAGCYFDPNHSRPAILESEIRVYLTPVADLTAVYPAQKFVVWPSLLRANHFSPKAMAANDYEFVFSAKGKFDYIIHIGPAREPRLTFGYEIVIGGWGNTKSKIRFKAANAPIADLATAQGSWCKEDEATTYWVAFKEGELRVGSGEIIGQKAFLSAEPPKMNDVSKLYIGFTGWQDPATYTLLRQTESDAPPTTAAPTAAADSE